MRALVNSGLLRSVCATCWLATSFPQAPRGCRRLCMSALDTGAARSLPADTIFALSSGAGVRAGVSVIRVSGPDAKEVLLRMTSSPKTGELPSPRLAVLRKLRWPLSHDAERSSTDNGQEAAVSSRAGELIDEVLALWFPGPRSFTGEDTVELHTHGSRAVVSRTLEALGCIPGLRMAEAGEFTRQAFQNGRMELTQVEGLADLINADTDEQRRQALQQMGGAQKRQYEAWREQLLGVCPPAVPSPSPVHDASPMFAFVRQRASVLVPCVCLLRATGSLAYTEALIDFGEDADDVTTAALRHAVEQVGDLRGQMRRRLADGGRGEVVREGVRVAILGPPNAGKSTLLNELAQRCSPPPQKP